MNGWTPDDARRWAELYRLGQTLHGVSQAVGWSRTTVQRALSSVGERRRPHGWTQARAGRYWQRSWTRAAAAMRASGIPWAEIAEHYGVSVYVARRHVARVLPRENNVARAGSARATSDREASTPEEGEHNG